MFEKKEKGTLRTKAQKRAEKSKKKIDAKNNIVELEKKDSK